MILEGAGKAFEGGWNKVKLYFMLGLPTETEDDMKGIAHLCEEDCGTLLRDPEGSAKRKMSDHSKYFFLCSEAIYPIPVGSNVPGRRIP